MSEVPEGRPVIVLDADGRVVVKRITNEICSAMRSVDRLLASEDGLDRGAAQSILASAEFQFAELGKKLGVKTDSEKDIQRRYQDLQRANMRIHELEGLVGKDQSPELVQLALQNFENRLARWWQQEGFGLVSDVQFGAYNCKFTLSCHMFGEYALVNSQTPVSDEEHKRLWIESWRQRGLVIFEKSDDVVDCDASRKVITELVESFLPSAHILSFENFRERERGGHKLRGVNVVVRKLQDIQNLPVQEREVLG